MEKRRQGTCHSSTDRKSWRDVRTKSYRPSWLLYLHLSNRFRWVSCQLQYLRHCHQPRIRRALNESPHKLDETYDRTLEEIGEHNWEYAHRLFQCVAAASRPLLVED